MDDKTKGIILAGLIAVAVFVWYIERRSDSVATAATQYGELPYKPLPVENPALQRETAD